MKQNQTLFLLLWLFLFALSACTTTKSAPNWENVPPIQEPLCKYGNPDYYAVDGQKYYVLKSASGYCKTGLASWYGTKFHGKNTSSREPYDMFAMTAASRNLPIPTYVEVTNLENGKKIVVKVNDRGPFKSDRIIDLSYAAASKLGFANKGTAKVEVRAIQSKDVTNGKISQEIILAHNGTISEVQINPLALPLPQQAAQSVTLDRYLQLGAFANHDNALKLQTEISTYTQATVIIKEGLSNNKPIYRVQVGPFKTAEESDVVVHALEKQGYKVITVFS